MLFLCSVLIMVICCVLDFRLVMDVRNVLWIFGLSLLISLRMFIGISFLKWF